MLDIRESKPVGPAYAGWLSSILLPALQRMKAEPYPIVFENAGFGAIARADIFSIDKRIVFSNVVRFYNRPQLLHTFAHELAHHLNHAAEEAIHPHSGFVPHHAHNACFFAVFFMLLKRLDSEEYDFSNGSYGLYEIQDLAPQLLHLPRHEAIAECMSWSIKIGAFYAHTELPAIDCAIRISKHFNNFCNELQNRPAKNAQMKADLTMWQIVSAISWVGFVGVVYLAFT